MNNNRDLFELQLKYWILNQNYHINGDKLEKESVVGLSTCVPDFSCCDPSIKTDEATKRKFQEAFLERREDITYQMMLMFVQKSMPDLMIIDATQLLNNGDLDHLIN